MIREMLTPPAALHALLFASGEPLSKKRLMSLLGLSSAQLGLALDALRSALKDLGTSVVETEGEIELRTAPEAAPLAKKLRESELSRDLGKASLETLAVISYAAGGTTRGEIDWVRGVNSSASLRTLLMRGLIEGREDEEDKRRIRYRITTEALGHLGVSSADSLPRYMELQKASKGALLEEQEEEI